ncbi:MAG: DEAD/DEAH box helicase [Myxococcales bacterium]|jgi:hypothetical protein|nr:DEAD/DEAH box helicase [Myxococcales bacterium]
MQEFFEVIRENCPRHNWSRAVELARIVGVVTTERETSEMVRLKVKASDELMSRTVALFLEDEDWTCDCRSKEGVCVHVAAAAIALNRARKAGEALPSATSRLAQVEHAFRRQSDGLVFERFLVVDGARQPLTTTLSALASGRVRGPQVAADRADLAMDLNLGIENRLFPLRDRLEKLIGLAADCTNVTLDGAPLTASRTPLAPEIVRLTDHPMGFRLTLERSPDLDEVFANGSALSGGVLHPISESRLTARERAELSQGRVFGAGQKIALMTEVLPDLQSRIRVLVESKRLPRLSDARARVHFEFTREGDALLVLPTLVYGDPPVARVDGGRLVSLANEVPIRDELFEDRLSRRLQRDLEMKPGHRATFQGEAAIGVVQKIEAWGRQKGEGSALITGEAQRAFHLAPPIAVDLAIEGDDFRVSFDSVAEDGRRAGHADPSAVLRAFREGASLVPLLDGGFAPLPVEWLRKHARTLADLLAAKQERDELPACALPDLARLADEIGAAPPPGFASLRPLIEDFAGLPELPLDLELDATLRGYQATGVRWLSFLKRARMGALLADDMGLGKTLQALAVLEKPALVVAPTSVLPNWRDEARRFRPGLKLCLFHGPSRQLDPDADVTLTSYALLRNDLDLLKQRRWRVLLLDEAQAIKNPDSQVARAAFALSADFRIALTGTPVENRLDELWSQFNFLNSGLLGTRADFDERYARPIAEGVPGRAAALRERIRPFVLRRLKREVASELPPRTESILRCELSEDELGLYQSLHAATRQEVVDKLTAGGNVLAALAALLRMRQACCHAALIPGQERFERSSKVELLVDKLLTLKADGHRALVFSQWTRLLDLIEPRLNEEGIGFVRLDGTTRDRGTVVSAFQQDDGPPVMLISLKAGGVGLNLTAADHVFLVDPWWNPAVEDQAADRAHRIGQDRPVFIHRLVALGTVEERILALQQSKRALAEAALSGAATAEGLTRDDLMMLLSEG